MSAEVSLPLFNLLLNTLPFSQNAVVKQSLTRVNQFVARNAAIVYYTKSVLQIVWSISIYSTIPQLILLAVQHFAR